MQLLSAQISGYIDKSSWIRRMFEAGMELKQKYGAENVYDFSLGNPDVPPPARVAELLREVADGLDQPLALGYMPNAGYPDFREALAARLSEEQGVEIGAAHVVVTCGAAGAINAFFRAVLEPGDEVICPAPYFVEYGFYAANFGGKMVPVKCPPVTFELDLTAIEAAIGPKTRVVLINSPNNPTGQIYGPDQIRQLGELLEQQTAKLGRPIFLVSDEPYRFLAYDGATVPPILPAYEYSIAVGSFSKSLSMAGERVGYLVANPAMTGVEQLTNGVVLTNRIVGYVNAPALGQKLAMAALSTEVDVNIYDERRRAMANVLENAGIEFSMPKGAFYFFPKAPTGDDDKAFVDLLMEERVLAVPGTGFGYPGFFHLTFCIDKDVIERSADGFHAATEKAANG